MRNFKKLMINPEKVIKNDGLLSLKGGYVDQGCTYLICADHDFQFLCDYCIAPQTNPDQICSAYCPGYYFTITVDNSPQCGC